MINVNLMKGEIKTNFASQRKTATHNAVEKLFRVDGYLS